MNNLPAIAERQNEVKAALAVVGKSHPAEVATIKTFLNMVATQDVRVLGANELFVVRSQDGKAISVKRPVDLSVADGTLVAIGTKDDSPVIISAQGYERLAEAANVIVINTPTVFVDGKEEQNPYIRRDKNGRIAEIVCRSVAFGYTTTGVPAVSDRTAMFPVDLYMMVDMLAKARYFPQAFKLMPADMGKPEEAGTWAKYPFDESTILWIDTSHKEALSWYAQNTNRQKKAIEFAQTFAQRNAVKHHPAIAKQKPPNNAATWRTEVYGWLQVEGQFKWNLAAYGQMMEEVADIAGGIVESDDIIIERGRDDLSEEIGGMESVLDAEDATVEDSENPVPPAQPQTNQTTRPSQSAPPATGSLEAQKKLRQAIGFAGEETFHEALGKCGLAGKSVESLTDGQITTVMGQINKLLDAAMGGGS